MLHYVNIRSKGRPKVMHHLHENQASTKEALK